MAISALFIRLVRDKDLAELLFRNILAGDIGRCHAALAGVAALHCGVPYGGQRRGAGTLSPSGPEEDGADQPNKCKFAVFR